jgi:hypothetical protein
MDQEKREGLSSSGLWPWAGAAAETRRSDVRVNASDSDPLVPGGQSDTRSSYYLEDAAILSSRFQDSIIDLVTWDADLRLRIDARRYHSFRGDTWTTIHKRDRQRYLLNAHRVC